MLFEGRTRSRRVARELELSDLGHLVTSVGAGRYQEPVLRGGVYVGANVLGTPVTTQAGLSATTPALTLWNPVGSGVYLSLLGVRVGINAAPAAASTLCLAVNAKGAAAPSSTTDATMYSTLLTGVTGSPKGRAYRVATLAAAPVAVRFLGHVLATGGTDTCVINHDVDGQLVLDEGVALSVQATTAIAIFCEFVWEEVPR